MGRRVADRQGGIGEVAQTSGTTATRSVVELSDLARRRSLLIAALVALRVKAAEPELGGRSPMARQPGGPRADRHGPGAAGVRTEPHEDHRRRVARDVPQQSGTERRSICNGREAVAGRQARGVGGHWEIGILDNVHAVLAHLLLQGVRCRLPRVQTQWPTKA